MGEADLIAPELLDVEVLSVMRRAVLHRRLDEERASLALADLVVWPIQRVPHKKLIAEAWQLHRNVSAYDAVYVAAARLYDATLVTADGPLSRVPNINIALYSLRIT